MRTLSMTITLLASADDALGPAIWALMKSTCGAKPDSLHTLTLVSKFHAIAGMKERYEGIRW